MHDIVPSVSQRFRVSVADLKSNTCKVAYHARQDLIFALRSNYLCTCVPVDYGTLLTISTDDAAAKVVSSVGAACTKMHQAERSAYQVVNLRSPSHYDRHSTVSGRVYLLPCRILRRLVGTV